MLAFLVVASTRRVIPTYVADEAAAVVRMAAAEIGPAADEIAEDAATLVRDPAALARALDVAVQELGTLGRS